MRIHGRIRKLGLSSRPRYQLSVHVRNDEPVPGVAGISFRSSDARATLAAFGQRGFSHVPGNTSLELGVVIRSPPREVRLETFPSQNRRIMRLALPEIDSETIAPGNRFGVRGRATGCRRASASSSMIWTRVSPSCSRPGRAFAWFSVATRWIARPLRNP